MSYLRREHPIVSWRATGKVGTTGGFNVASELGDADNLNERELNRSRRGDEDGIHGIIRHALANQGLVQHNGDVVGLKLICRAYPT